MSGALALVVASAGTRGGHARSRSPRLRSAAAPLSVCLFKADAYFIGYPLFGAIFLAAVWGLGAAAGAFVSSSVLAREAFPAFARSRMARQALAWTFALALGALPVVIYAVASPGASLFR